MENTLSLKNLFSLQPSQASNYISLSMIAFKDKLNSVNHKKFKNRSAGKKERETFSNTVKQTTY